MSKAKPEHGFFYRTVDQHEIDIFTKRPADYGMPAPTVGNTGPTYKELARIPSMKAYKCQKFLSTRQKTKNFEAGRLKLLIVDETLLAADDWDIDPETTDAAIKGEAVVRAGVLINFNDPLPARPVKPQVAPASGTQGKPEAPSLTDRDRHNVSENITRLGRLMGWGDEATLAVKLSASQAFSDRIPLLRKEPAAVSDSDLMSSGMVVAKLIEDLAGQV